MPNKQLLEDSARNLLDAFGANGHPGTIRTPERFALTFTEEIDTESPEEILKGAIIKGESYSGLIVEKALSFFSLCEHHLLPFFGEATIGYVPDGRIVGLSKLPRVLRTLANGPNLQERLTRRVAEVIQQSLSPKGVAVILEASHLCMVARGVRIDASKTATSFFTGVFLEPGSIWYQELSRQLGEIKK